MSKVLIVDNSLFIRTTLKQILEEAGHTVVGTAGNGKEAVELFVQLKPDVVTLDLVMDTPDRRISASPEETSADGLAALKSIRARDPQAVVFIVTAGRTMSDKAKALGAAGVIFKPLNAEQIRLAMQKARVAVVKKPPSAGPSPRPA